ncbi:hypothetical protein D9615_009421 [Tricholomella constricta]|uniref:Alpha/beta hydrolase fold-3 domain-containing protein n=1 Tax=Tricholomella constricta TaxID=117010 RepID=A0A8H5GYK2_9AGAR|nr:hypothetical protein D9615_009421 [Tricholomella constricta]
MADLVPKQPLHPSFISRLDPEYIAFHNSTLQYITPPHTLPWDPALRNAPAVPGASPPLDVAKTQDFDIVHTRVRAFTPFGETPHGGWPALLYFHGGGWTLGNISSETSFATNMAVRAKSVVVSVDYRLAPENPYPAAVDDAIDALQWLVRSGAQELGINTDRIAVGGSSSGGNLAAVLALKAPSLSPPIPLTFQLLIVPVTDNTIPLIDASAPSTWATNAHTPWLSPARMAWFRTNYLPRPSDQHDWAASPLLAPRALLAAAPRAWVGVCECDGLCGEGLAYAASLREAGVQAETRVYEGAPHPVMAMDEPRAAAYYHNFYFYLYFLFSARPPTQPRMRPKPKLNPRKWFTLPLRRKPTPTTTMPTAGPEAAGADDAMAELAQSLQREIQGLHVEIGTLRRERVQLFRDIHDIMLAKCQPQPQPQPPPPSESPPIPFVFPISLSTYPRPDTSERARRIEPAPKPEPAPEPEYEYEHAHGSRDAVAFGVAA